MATSLEDRIVRLTHQIRQHPIYVWRYDRSREWQTKTNINLAEVIGSCFEDAWHALCHWKLVREYGRMMRELRRLHEEAHL